MNTPQQSNTNYTNNVNGAGKQPKHRSRAGSRFVIAALIILLIAAGTVIFFLMKDRTADTGSADQEKIALEIKDKVAKLMYLPDETPTITTIENADELKGQKFFEKVQTGDQVLIFLNDARVIIYRPSENKIVNAGPIVNDTATENQPQDKIE